MKTPSELFDTPSPAFLDATKCCEKCLKDLREKGRTDCSCHTKAKDSWEKRVKDRFHELTDNEQISVNVMASVLMLVGEEIVCALEEGRKKEREEVMASAQRLMVGIGDMNYRTGLTDLITHLQEKNN